MFKIEIVLPLLAVTYFSLPSLPLKVVFKSTESKVENNKPVFNEVWLEEEGDNDIWMMNQSHHGLDYPKSEWDQVKIIVDKKTKTTTFHQLKDNEEIPLKVDCNMCHSNGPRTINPNPKSVTLLDKLKVLQWNIRIKSYGTLQQPKSDNHQYLKSETCIKCHNGGENFWERSKIKKENFLAIKYLVKNNLMPPWPFKLSESEKEKLLNQLK